MTEDEAERKLHSDAYQTYIISLVEFELGLFYDEQGSKRSDMMN